MNNERLPKRSSNHPLRIVGVLLLVVFAPLVCLLQVGNGLRRLSYDIPFVWRYKIATPEVVIVYLDEASAAALGQRVSDVWDRSLHTRLLNRLTRDGAKAVYYDIVFSAPNPNPVVDQDLAQAISRNGRVILGAALDESIDQGVYTQTIFPPAPLLMKSAAAWGILLFRPIDPDYAIRQLYAGDEVTQTASWAAAQLLDAPVTHNPEERTKERWLNYYGPPGSLPSVSFYQALQDDGVAPGYFKDKVVFVGGRPVVGALNLGRDEFANPYSRWGHLFFPGVDVHATEFLNLMRGDWLTRMPPWQELSLLLLCGLVMAAIAIYVPPVGTFCLGLVMAGIVSGSALWLAWYQRVWFDWLVPVAIQIPMGVIWCAASQYLTEARKRAELRHAFYHYLSPRMVDRIANSDFDLKPGGKVVETTVVFTDCKGFTEMSEELKDPALVAETLISYFTKTSDCVLENEGTIIKYIGDALLAVWGAPIDEPDHAYKAALAGWKMREASKMVVMGRVLTTRVGICSGPVLVGNLGCPNRFDYTLVGHTVNTANRLEELNKLLNTTILISDSTRGKLGDRFVTRLVGNFALAGLSDYAPVHELICPAADASAASQDWIEIFAKAIEAIRMGDFKQAQLLLRKTIWERGGADGPSEFYLKKITQLEETNALQAWTGTIKLTKGAEAGN